MRIRGVLVFTAVLTAAAVGLAMAAGDGAPTAQPAQSAPQGGQAGPPQGPPPGGPGGGPQGIERLLFEVNLTAAQLEQVKTLVAAQREAGATYDEQLRQVGEKMRAIVEAATFDEAAARKLALQEAAAMAELRVLGARTEAAIYQLLTDEQKTALADLRDQQPARPPRRGR
jgi:Spy/CpxP family protein refolding chaperone